MTMPKLAVALAIASAVASADAAQAQSMSATSSSYNAGYGRNPGDESRPVDPNTRDANGNRLVVDGVIQTGAASSAYARSSAFGAAFSGAGAGFGQVGGSTAIGNNLVVITQGNWNTVIVDSTQINTGDVTAVTDLNGQVDLDDDGNP